MTQLSLDRRDILIMQEIHYKRNKNINSQLIAKKLDRIVLELGLKQMELNKALFYTYKDNKIKIKDYTGLRLNPYLYFLKLAIIFYYQMIDKFSFYINQKYRLNIDKTYFKDIIKKISDNSSNINLIDDKFIDLYNSEEYYQLNVLRQSIIHKEKYINYEKNSKKISSLLISITSMANLIILNIINEYLKENGHVVTNEAIIESNQKSLYRKL
ncbi:hypothetical protein [Clostridium beijerinckii]|uniref:hypothetical protein n=1 Tax=Clostridium beijerinckii TaxID=1520 RepID=UPI00156F547C|nr:hypothetical protein [Clostridium beijerinckii]